MELLINAGVIINDPIISIDKYLIPFTNNDVLSYAAQCGKIDIIEVLLKHNVHINLHNNIPIALIVAIRYNREDVVSYLIKNEKINKICSSEKQALLDVCVNIGFGNKNIMKHFADPEYIDMLELNHEEITINNIEKELEKCIYNYKDNREQILLGLRNILNFIISCGEIDDKNDICMALCYHDNINITTNLNEINMMMHIFIKDDYDKIVKCLDLVQMIKERYYDDKFVEDVIYNLINPRRPAARSLRRAWANNPGFAWLANPGADLRQGHRLALSGKPLAVLPHPGRSARGLAAAAGVEVSADRHRLGRQAAGGAVCRRRRPRAANLRAGQEVRWAHPGCGQRQGHPRPARDLEEAHAGLEAEFADARRKAKGTPCGANSGG